VRDTDTDGSGRTRHSNPIIDEDTWKKNVFFFGEIGETKKISKNNFRPLKTSALAGEQCENPCNTKKSMGQKKTQITQQPNNVYFVRRVDTTNDETIKE